MHLQIAAPASWRGPEIDFTHAAAPEGCACLQCVIIKMSPSSITAFPLRPLRWGVVLVLVAGGDEGGGGLVLHLVIVAAGFGCSQGPRKGGAGSVTRRRLIESFVS